MSSLDKLLDEIYGLADKLLIDGQTEETVEIARAIKDKASADIAGIEAQIAEDASEAMRVEISADIRDEAIADFTAEADRLHAAICEGRKQDAIDILNAAVPEANLRRVETQNYLFPDRVVS